MPKPTDVEYKVVLVFPGYGTERENAEQIVEEALEWLNTHRDKPGFRFAPDVTAQLEIVPDVEQAQAKLDEDDAVAMMILHDLAEDERDAFTWECASHKVGVCHTFPALDEADAPRRDRGKPRELKFTLKKRSENEPSAHKIPDITLTASLDTDEGRLIERVQQLIAVMALGVMEHHFSQKPPRVFE